MKILFLATGGTIDKGYPRKTKGYSFEIGEPAVGRILERVNPTFEHRVKQVTKKDSLDLNEADRQKIFDACKKAREKFIIITHGTDTMPQTAKKLSGIKGKTIIIVGAMRPEHFANTDAHFHVGAAVGALPHLENGVYIGMNGQIHPWDKCKRNTKTGQYIEKIARKAH